MKERKKERKNEWIEKMKIKQKKIYEWKRRNALEKDRRKTEEWIRNK